MPGIDDNKSRCSSKENVNKRWTAISTLSINKGNEMCTCCPTIYASKTHDGYVYSPQTAVPSPQAQPYIKASTPEAGELRWHLGDTIYKKCSYMNKGPMRQKRGTSAVDNRRETGCIPDLQRPMHSTTREHYAFGSQTTTD